MKQYNLNKYQKIFVCDVLQLIESITNKHQNNEYGKIQNVDNNGNILVKWLDGDISQLQCNIDKFKTIKISSISSFLMY